MAAAAAHSQEICGAVQQQTGLKGALLLAPGVMAAETKQGLQDCQWAAAAAGTVVPRARLSGSLAAAGTGTGTAAGNAHVTETGTVKVIVNGTVSGTVPAAGTGTATVTGTAARGIALRGSVTRAAETLVQMPAWRGPRAAAAWISTPRWTVQLLVTGCHCSVQCLLQMQLLGMLQRGQCCSMAVACGISSRSSSHTAAAAHHDSVTVTAAAAGTAAGQAAARIVNGSHCVQMSHAAAARSVIRNSSSTSSSRQCRRAMT
jgi:hypothetical protein